MSVQFFLSNESVFILIYYVFPSFLFLQNLSLNERDYGETVKLKEFTIKLSAIKVNDSQVNTLVQKVNLFCSYIRKIIVFGLFPLF